MTLNDLEPSKKRFYSFFSQFLDAAHISTLNCDEMAGDRLRQPANEIFSTKRWFQQSKSRPLRFKEAGAGGHQRPLPPKSGYFTAIISCSVKKVVDRYRYLLTMTSNIDKLFIGVNVDDLEWPWTSKIWVFSEFSRFPAATHILRVNCAEMTGDGLEKPA